MSIGNQKPVEQGRDIPKRAEERTDKRTRILEAALVIFSRKGYYPAKVEEIAEQAGVGKGTVYEYFPSKLILFQEMFLMVMDRYRQQLSTALEEDAPIRTRIRDMFEMHLRFVVENREFTLVTFYEIGGWDEELLAWMYDMRRQKIDYLKALYQEGVTRGEFRQGNPALAASVLASLLHGMVDPVILDNEPCEPAAWADETAEMFFAGIAK